jgi:hypothetical protein
MPSDPLWLAGVVRRTSRPVRRILLPAMVSPAGGHPSRPAVASRLQRPTRRHRAGSPQTPARATALRWWPFLALLRVGFTEPSRSPGTLVGSYPAVSPLPGRGPAVCFLWHFPAGHPGLPLATTLPYGVRTFLGDEAEPRRRDRPVDSSVATTILRRRPEHAHVGRLTPIAATKGGPSR